MGHREAGTKRPPPTNNTRIVRRKVSNLPKGKDSPENVESFFSWFGRRIRLSKIGGITC